MFHMVSINKQSMYIFNIILIGVYYVYIGFAEEMREDTVALEAMLEPKPSTSRTIPASPREIVIEEPEQQQLQQHQILDDQNIQEECAGLYIVCQLIIVYYTKGLKSTFSPYSDKLFDGWRHFSPLVCMIFLQQRL